ncbi:MAG: hypothetical protein ACJATT_005347 [Myxococcota bacterium]|jgi:hypothetical protein
MSTLRAVMTGLGLACASSAWAQVDANCAGIAQPEDYEEQVQQDFLQNYTALGFTMSALHAPVPHEAGRGSIGLDLAVIPPLGCTRRFVLDWTKTEETNKLPVVPKPRVSFAFPALGPVRLYAGMAYLPPVTVDNNRVTLVSGEFGAGFVFGSSEKFQLGARFHATSAKAVADIATAFRISDPAVLDYYQSNTFGLDASVGYALGTITPWASVGVTDVSTLFVVGDDGVIANNLHPYAGPVASVGVDGLVKNRFRWGAEFYAAPGGNSRPDPEASNVAFGRAGHMYTARFRVAVEL